MISACRGLLLVNKSQQDTPPFPFPSLFAPSTEHDFRLQLVAGTLTTVVKLSLLVNQLGKL